MSLVSRIESLILRLAAEFKAIRRDLGNPTELTTRDQSNLVAAINEVRALIDVTPGLNIIDDENPNAVGTTFSASGIVRRLDQLKADILGGADGAFDTLKELQDALAGDASGIAALTRALESRVRFDEPQDTLGFSGASIAPGESAQFSFLITDMSPVAKFYLFQQPLQPVSEATPPHRPADVQQSAVPATVPPSSP